MLPGPVYALHCMSSTESKTINTSTNHTCQLMERNELIGYGAGHAEG